MKVEQDRTAQGPKGDVVCLERRPCNALLTSDSNVRHVVYVYLSVYVVKLRGQERYLF